MLEHRLKLGRFFGISLYVHWTFTLLIAFVAYSSQEQGLPGILFGLAQLVGVFLCVTLHEYGHALAARKFGIPTIDITLLPIGGVARLQRMPRIAWQELVVAVAGPAVNVVIATLLLAGLIVFGMSEYLKVAVGLPTDNETFRDATLLFVEPSIFGFTVAMLAINLMLVLFNLIPAFPMDGGRVLRSLLAMVTDYRVATQVASRIGVVCALLMASVGMYFGNWVLVLIAMFIAYAGLSEARQVEVTESVRGLFVDDCVTQYPTSIPLDMPLDELGWRWRFLAAETLPVVAVDDIVVGVLSLKEVVKAIDSGTPMTMTAGQLANHDVPQVQGHESLERALLRAGGNHRQLPVVDVHGHLQGLLDLDSMLTRVSLTKRFGRRPQVALERFDAVT